MTSQKSKVKNQKYNSKFKSIFLLYALTSVIPAKAGIQSMKDANLITWIPDRVRDDVKRKFALKTGIKTTFNFLLVLLPFAFCLLPSSQTFAAEQTLRISPVIINVTLSPGKTYNHEVTIENLTNAPLPLRATLNDFLTSGEEGGYVFEETKDNPLLQWINLDETEFLLNPKEKKTIQMTITTPKSISLGGYYGILFFEPVYIDDDPSRTRVSSKVGVLMLANVGVPDPNAPKAEIVDFSPSFLSQDGTAPLLLRVKNISLNFFTAKPILTLTPLINNVIPDLIRDPRLLDSGFRRNDGEEGGNDKARGNEIILEDKTIFPGKLRRWTEESTLQDLAPNIYKAHMAVSTGNGQYVTTEKYFVVFPLFKALFSLIVVLLVAYLIVKRKRLKRAAIAIFK